jgi:GAF domain-containing protein
MNVLEFAHGGDDEERQRAALQRYATAGAHSAALILLTDLTARLFAVPMAAIALLDGNGEVLAYRRGLSLEALPRRGGLVREAVRGDAVLVVEDAAKDSRFAESPLVAAPINVRFWACAPLKTPAGVRIGALCIMDTAPRALEQSDRELLTGLAGIVIDEFELQLNAAALQGEAERSRSAEETADQALARLESLEYDLTLQSVARTLADIKQERRGPADLLGASIVPVWR